MDALEKRLLRSLRKRLNRSHDALIYPTASLARDLKISKPEALAALGRLHEQGLICRFDTNNAGPCWRAPIFARDDTVVSLSNAA